MSSMVDGDQRKRGDGCKHETVERIKTCRFWHFQRRFGVEDGWGRDGQTGEHGGDKGHIQEVSSTASQLTRFVRVRG